MGGKFIKIFIPLRSSYFFILKFNFPFLQGSNLVEQSSLLIHENEVSRVFTGLWFTNVSVFLFDHQLILCKKVGICLKVTVSPFISE